MTRLSIDRTVLIHALRDYLMHQYDRMNPLEVMRLLTNIARSFPAGSVSRRLAEQFRERIQIDWRAGILTRYLLILHAFPMLYESAVNLVDTRRRWSVIFNFAIMNEVFPPPNQANPLAEL